MRAYAKPLLALSLLAGYVAVQFAASGAGGASAAAGPPAQQFPTPPTKITTALATVPPDFAGLEVQGNINLYSWLAFVALNWPADTSTCGPNLQQTILNDKGPRVWETYSADSDIFVKPPATPVPWCAPRDTKQLFRNSKASEIVSQKFPGIDEAVGGVLTDQNGRFVRYEVRVNPDEYKFIVQNNLWNQTGQDRYTQTQQITFPFGPSSYGPTGAIEVKAAWKVLSPREIARGRFFTTTAYVYNTDLPPPPSPQPTPDPKPVTLGLVGFHIMHKTRLQPNWLWSTFEHVDNLKPPPGSLKGAKASFRNPDCPPRTCPPNVQTAKEPYTELDANGKPLNRPVQVVRINPTGDSTAAQYNAAFRKLLAGSVWANYELISTQWFGEAGVLPKPPFLANMTMETFIQSPRPPSDGPIPYPSPGYDPFKQGVASSSCMKCHSVATTASGKAKADFSFIMGNAQ